MHSKLTKSALTRTLPVNLQLSCYLSQSFWRHNTLKKPHAVGAAAGIRYVYSNNTNPKRKGNDRMGMEWHDTLIVTHRDRFSVFWESLENGATMGSRGGFGATFLWVHIFRLPTLLELPAMRSNWSVCSVHRSLSRRNVFVWY